MIRPPGKEKEQGVGERKAAEDIKINRKGKEEKKKQKLKPLYKLRFKHESVKYARGAAEHGTSRAPGSIGKRYVFHKLTWVSCGARSTEYLLTCVIVRRELPNGMFQMHHYTTRGTVRRVCQDEQEQPFLREGAVNAKPLKKGACSTTDTAKGKRIRRKSSCNIGMWVVSLNASTYEMPRILNRQYS